MKEKKCLSSIVLLLILVFLIGITVIDSSAGELQDSRLPSQMLPQVYIQSPELSPSKSMMPQQLYNQSSEQIKPKSSLEMPDDVYEKFRQDVKKRTPQDRKMLKEGFEKKAAQTGSETEKAYYYRLIAILCEIGIK